MWVSMRKFIFAVIAHAHFVKATEHKDDLSKCRMHN